MSVRKDYTIFPTSLVEETIRILQANGAEFARAADFWPEAARLRTLHDRLREYAQWQTGRSGRLAFLWWCAERLVRRRLLRLAGKDPSAAAPDGRPVVFLHHDADSHPDLTMGLMELEQRLGVVSSAYFFRRRACRHPADVEPYDLDLEAMKRLERAGFEIGCHINGPELANYRWEEGWRIVREDVAFFRANFQLRSFVPHGGRNGPNGENNHHIKHRDCLEDLIWFYSGAGLSCDVNWSDGMVEYPDSDDIKDPREVARSVRGRMRAHFLFHPQYYGARYCEDWKNAGVVRTAWWQGLWKA